MNPTHTTRTAIALLAIAFFAAPIAARLGGMSAETFENRRLAQPPKLSQGWNAFGQATQYLTDHMPLRAQAIHANTQIWTNIFDTDPRYGQDATGADDHALPFTGTVKAPPDKRRGIGLQRAATSAKAGRAGWLYTDFEFESACDDRLSNEQVLERWGELVQAVRDAGHQTALFVVPDKASIYPEYLPEKYPFDHCALREKEKFWRQFAQDGPARGVFELRSELLRLKAKAGDNLFQRKDLHWTTLGAVTLVDAALDALGDGVQFKQSEIVARGSVSYEGDLSRARGESETDTRAEYDLVRADDAPRVPGRTLLVCDSFAYQWMRLFKPYFEDVRYVAFYSGADYVTDAIRRADTVIFESEEINLKDYAARHDGVPAFIREVRAGKP
jgi:alginate O-acetyltransferase complex protein AlgJ